MRSCSESARSGSSMSKGKGKCLPQGGAWPREPQKREFYSYSSNYFYALVFRWEPQATVSRACNPLGSSAWWLDPADGNSKPGRRGLCAPLTWRKLDLTFLVRLGQQTLHGSSYNRNLLSTYYVLYTRIISLNLIPLWWVLLAQGHTVAQMAESGFKPGCPEARVCDTTSHF